MRKNRSSPLESRPVIPASSVTPFARGWRSDNPVRNLEADEKPEIESRQKRILETADIQRLLAAMPEKYRPIFQTAVFTGARIGEVLGLRWSDINFNRQVIRITRQLTQQGELAEPKTANAKREIVMFPNLATMLREHRLRSPFSKDGDFVFATRTGTPFSQRNVTKRGLEKAADAAGLNRPGQRLHSHDLRHTFASILIREGADVVFVARQLGHANPAITLRVYAHLFDSENQGNRMREALEVRFGGTPQATALHAVEGRR
jgi:integrase